MENELHILQLFPFLNIHCFLLFDLFSFQEIVCASNVYFKKQRLNRSVSLQSFPSFFICTKMDFEEENKL